jgi:hypothetical protein
MNSCSTKCQKRAQLLSEGANRKLQRDEFVQYKMSEESAAIIRRSKENAVKKKYHHHLESGGYMSAIPKWERMEW